MAAKDPHGPNKYTNYFDVHERVMRGFVDGGFVLDDGLTAIPLGNGNISMEGTIECIGGIIITVEKLLVVTPAESGEWWIQSATYSYNASIRGIGSIFRYDAPHPDHNRFKHVHRFDVLSGDDEGTVEVCDQPTLGAVLAEAEKWYWDHRERLANGVS
ncbi:MAG: hypothetical protein ACT4OZ_03800 [Gemmatimonadota bacterium]